MTDLIFQGLVSGIVIFIGLVIMLLLFPRARGKKSSQSHGDPISAESILHMIEKGQRIQAMKALRRVSGISHDEALTVVKEVEAGNSSLLRSYFGS